VCAADARSVCDRWVSCYDHCRYCRSCFFSVFPSNNSWKQVLWTDQSNSRTRLLGNGLILLGHHCLWLCRRDTCLFLMINLLRVIRDWNDRVAEKRQLDNWWENWLTSEETAQKSFTENLPNNVKPQRIRDGCVDANTTNKEMEDFILEANIAVFSCKKHCHRKNGTRNMKRFSFISVAFSCIHFLRTACGKKDLMLEIKMLRTSNIVA